MIYWRLGVAMALVASAMRVGGLGFLLDGTVWYALQFGPLLALGVIEAIGGVRASAKNGIPGRALWVVVPAAALVLVAASSALWAEDSGQTLRQAGLLALVFLFLVSTFLHRWAVPGNLQGDLKTVFWTGVAVQAIGVAGYFAGQAWSVGPYGRFVGVTTNANFAGVGAAVLVALSFAFSGLAFRIASLIPLAALVLSGSRGSMVGLMLGLIAVLIAVPKMRRSGTTRVWAVAMISITPLLFWLRSVNLFGALYSNITFAPPGGDVGGVDAPPPDTDITSGRLQIYWENLLAWTRHPLLGTGYRSAQVDVSGHVFEAHNVYLSVLVELGVVGAVIVLALLVGMWRVAAPKTVLIAAAVAALSVEFTESSLFGFGGPVALQSWLVLFGWAASGLPTQLVEDDRAAAT